MTSHKYHQPMYFDRGYEDYRRRMYQQKENKYKQYLNRVGRAIFGKSHQTQDEQIESLIRIIIIITFIYVVIKWIKDDPVSHTGVDYHQFGGRVGFETCNPIRSAEPRV